MGFGFSTSPASVIGLDLGAYAIKLVQLQQQDGRWTVQTADQRVLTEPLLPGKPVSTGEIGGLIRQMLDGGGFTGQRVVSSLPAASLQYKNLRLPKMPPDELGQAVRWEAAERLRLGGDGFQLQYLDAGEVRQGDEVREEIIVLAATSLLVEEHVNLLLSCGLDPLAIDASPGALSRLAQQWQDPDPNAASQVVIDVGYASSKVLIQRNGRVVFFKLIEIGGRQFDQAAAEHLNQPPAEAARLRRGAANANTENAGEALLGSARKEDMDRAIYEAVRGVAGDLAREVGLCLRYYSVSFRGRRPEAAVLVGGEAAGPHIAEVLSEAAGIRVMSITDAPGDSLAALTDHPALRTGLHSWASVLGLAMRGRTAAALRGAA